VDYKRPTNTHPHFIEVFHLKALLTHCTLLGLVTRLRK